MGGARSRLEKRRLHIGQVLDGEDLAGGIGAVFRESTRQGHAADVRTEPPAEVRGRHSPVRFKVLAQEQLAASAVEALVAEFLSRKVRRRDCGPRRSGRPTELSATTRSPMLKSFTFLPMAATTPTTSWPGMRGN